MVCNHFEKVLKFLKGEGVVRNESTILYNTDGCFSKSIVDGLNGTANTN